MQQLPFIYSNSRNWRLARHFSFWFLWFLFQLFIYSFSPSTILQQQPLVNRVLLTFPETLIYLLPGIFLAYTLMYWVIPSQVLKRHYALAFVSSLMLILITAAFSALLSVTVIDYVRHFYGKNISTVVARELHPPFHIQFGIAMLAGLRGSITVGGVAAAIKLMKCFYEQQQAALTLEREKVKAELQLLKAQLHPHFLLNTLNNIYSFTQNVAPKASGMLMSLAELLRYVLYDCNKPLVSLDKELQMIRDYIELESTRYNKELDMAVQMPAHPTNLLIAPLLLLPFIENAFKHGASQMLEQPWISLSIDVRDEDLKLKLINGKPPASRSDKAGIGINNVRKRLELLYAGQYELAIKEEDELFIVNLRLKCQQTGDIAKKKTINELI